MIRKQLYIGREHQEKLRRIAARWGCTEAEVVRVALERLPDLESAGDARQVFGVNPSMAGRTTAELKSAIDTRLVEAGLLVPPPDDPLLPEGAELEALEAEYEAWVDGLPAPLGLTEAVLEDRR